MCTSHPPWNEYRCECEMRILRWARVTLQTPLWLVALDTYILRYIFICKLNVRHKNELKENVLKLALN